MKGITLNIVKIRWELKHTQLWHELKMIYSRESTEQSKNHVNLAKKIEEDLVPTPKHLLGLLG